MTFEIIKLFFFLFLILGFFYAVIFYLKKSSNRFTKGLLGTTKINVISTKMLMPKKYVTIIQVFEKYYLLGVSDSSVNLICELDGNNFNELLNANADNMKKNQSFLTLLKQNLGIK